MNVLFLSTMAWDETGGTYAPTRLALELASRGHRVAFLEHRRSETRDTRGLNISIAGLEEFGVHPLAVMLAWRGVPLGALTEIFPRIEKWLDETFAANEPRIVVLNSPFAPFAQLLAFLQTRGAWCVYYAQDDYAAMFALGMNQFNPRLEDYLVTRADLNLALAEPVAKKLARFGRNVELVPDAVEPREFQNATHLPANVLRGAECTLGMWGSLIAPMVDAELLRALAQAKPQWAINLLGPYEPVPQAYSVYEPLAEFPNVRFHGRVPHAELKNYARAFDVCLIPAPDNEMSRGRDPIKLYEYLACYKPVVATHMPQLQGIPYVHIASGAQQAITEIERARQEHVELRVLDEFLKQHTWSQRADTFLELTARMLHQPRARYGAFDAAELEQIANAQPIARLEVREWQQLLAALGEHAQLKQEVAQLQQWAQELERANHAHEQSLTARFRKFIPTLK